MQTAIKMLIWLKDENIFLWIKSVTSLKYNFMTVTANRANSQSVFVQLQTGLDVVNRTVASAQRDCDHVPMPA